MMFVGQVLQLLIGHRHAGGLQRIAQPIGQRMPRRRR